MSKTSIEKLTIFFHAMYRSTAMQTFIKAVVKGYLVTWIEIIVKNIKKNIRALSAII